MQPIQIISLVLMSLAAVIGLGGALYLTFVEPWFIPQYIWQIVPRVNIILLGFTIHEIAGIWILMVIRTRRKFLR